MVVAGGLIELAEVQKPREFIEVKHRIIPAVLTKEGDVLAEEHVFQVIRNKTPVASLYTLSKLLQDLAGIFRLHKEKFRF